MLIGGRRETALVLGWSALDLAAYARNQIVLAVKFCPAAGRAMAGCYRLRTLASPCHDVEAGSAAVGAGRAFGEVFAVKVGNRLYYPQAFLGLDRQTVAAICRALGDLGASEKLMFWLRDHGALAGNSIAAALEDGIALAKVERLAAVWACERGAAHGAARAVHRGVRAHR